MSPAASQLRFALVMEDELKQNRKPARCRRSTHRITTEFHAADAGHLCAVKTAMAVNPTTIDVIGYRVPLSEMFSVDICTSAILFNHYLLVLCVVLDRDKCG